MGRRVPSAPPGPRLIVTADDYGVDPAVNEAVEIAHREGILTATSLMVGGAAVADAVARARAMPRLGVGLHVVLADGAPVLPRAQVSTLVGRDGRFPQAMVWTALKIAFWPRARAQMRAEVAAQFAAFAATGLTLDHVNAHKHFHLHPMIAAAIVNEGRHHGLRAIRVPREVVPGLAGRLMAWWAGALGAQWRQQGLAVNDRVVGLAATGGLDATRMLAALAAPAPGVTEIYCHPATSDDWPGAVPGARYTDELAALTDPRVIAALAASGAASGPFARVNCDAAEAGTAPAAIPAAG